MPAAPTQSSGASAATRASRTTTPIACAINPGTGRERTFERSPRTARGLRLVVVGAGPAGIAVAIDAARSGHEVVLLERAARLGGQIALAGAAPGSRELAEAFLGNAERHLASAGVEVRLDTAAGTDQVREADAVVVATGARPYREHALRLDGVEVVQAWDVLVGQLPSGGHVVVADLGGDPGGLDAAELLAAAGKSVTLAVASVAVGESVHQYRRNLYLQRLYRASVTIAPHLELESAADGAVLLRNVFAPERVTTLRAEAVVLALGRVPEDELASLLRAEGLTVEEAGDCLTPRSLEEAVLEGTLAARRVFA